MSEIYEALKKAEREKKGQAERASASMTGTGQRSDRSGREPLLVSSIPTEEYQKMHGALRSTGTDREIKTLLVLSSVHGEGTSSVCSQFARSMAQSDEGKILLVDANLRTPVLHQLFGLERDGGLVELLEEKIPLEQAIRETESSGLFVVTAGAPTEEVSRLLGSPRLKTILAQWRKEYSLVIFDTSPALAYADAVVLGRLFDGVILVVQASKTRWEVIQRAREILKNAKAEILGVVLNRRQYVIPRRVYRRL
jgi:capsular exopolysaccharide synthesis family protein